MLTIYRLHRTSLSSPPLSLVTVDTHVNVTGHQTNALHAATTLWHPALKKQAQTSSPPKQATTAISKILPHTHHRPTQPTAAVAGSSHCIPALEVSASQRAPVEASSSNSPLPLDPLTFQSSSNWQSNSRSSSEEKHKGQAFLAPDLSEEDFLPSFAAASSSSSPSISSAFPSSSTVPLLAPSSSPAAASLSTAAPPTYSEKEKNKSPEAQQQQQPDSEPPPPYTETICPLRSFTFNMAAAGIITQVKQSAPQLTGLAGTDAPFYNVTCCGETNSRIPGQMQLGKMQTLSWI